jgi:hypothetical protein
VVEEGVGKIIYQNTFHGYLKKKQEKKENRLCNNLKLLHNV